MGHHIWVGTIDRWSSHTILDRCYPTSGMDLDIFVLLTALNLFPVKFYGEIEFWMASIKLTAVIGWIIYAFCMVCGAGKTGPWGSVIGEMGMHGVME